jgi:hypothetical protein
VGAESAFGAEGAGGVEGADGAAGVLVKGGELAFDVASAAFARPGDTAPTNAHAARTATCDAQARARMRYADDPRKTARKPAPLAARRDANTITTAFSKGRSGTTVTCPV